MKQPRDHRDCLDDICKAAQKAMDFVHGTAYESFLVDEKTVYAVVRTCQVSCGLLISTTPAILAA
jgi:uncharacterized protein with HEPN domain